MPQMSWMQLPQQGVNASTKIGIIDKFPSQEIKVLTIKGPSL